MSEIVKYHNYMNSLIFNGFTVTDFNFLLSLCSRMKDKDLNRVTFTFTELRILTNYKKSNSIKQFVKDLKEMNEKLMKITCSLKTETEIIMFVLFPTFAINLDEQTLTVSVNERFRFILNELIKNFTRFDLQEFVSLESKYSKSLYRLLKQYRTTGKYEVSVDDFRAKMDCPESYNNKQFMQNIINPALKSLQNYFQNLQCEPKYARKRGMPVIGYIFTFMPENVKSQTDHAQAHRGNEISNKKDSDGYAAFPQRRYDFEKLEGNLLKRDDNECGQEDIEKLLEEFRK